ncbi:hypothetical protein ACRALDRAFT_2019879, partial [Sodiomyces alcalophilus JCM 7366]|uniref:uncharacterized protein n=1 Tax=Sodiomyces alcalophilus JCM 7366 TaxID=591952 RepID=UPI0039B3BE06
EEAFCSLLNSGVVHCLPYPSSPVTDLSPYKPNYPAHPFEDQEPYRKPLKQKRSLSHLILCQGHLRHRDSRSSPNTANESKLPAPIFSNRPSRFIRRRSRRQQRQKNFLKAPDNSFIIVGTFARLAYILQEVSEQQRVVSSIIGTQPCLMARGEIVTAHFSIPTGTVPNLTAPSVPRS